MLGSQFKPTIMLPCNPCGRLLFNPSHSLIILVFFLTLPSSRLLFNYTSFNPNIHELIYSGDATSSSPAIQLTRNQNDKLMGGSSGRVTYTEPLHLRDNASGKVADFTTHFSFIINSQNSIEYGDGIAFFLVPVGFSIPAVQDVSGLGPVSGNQTLNSTLNPFVAVEFDTFPNSWDPNDDHVAININSMKSIKNVTWANLIPSGQLNTARINYNSSTQTLSVTFTDFERGSGYPKHLTAKVDLSKYLPEWVTYGFSASTGENFEIHSLHTWDFTTTLEVAEVKVSLTPSQVQQVQRQSE